MSMPLIINSDSLVHLYDYPLPAILDADDDGDNADERKNTSGRWQRFLWRCGTVRRAKEMFAEMFEMFPTLKLETW